MYSSWLATVVSKHTSRLQRVQRERLLLAEQHLAFGLEPASQGQSVLFRLFSVMPTDTTLLGAADSRGRTGQHGTAQQPRQCTVLLQQRFRPLLLLPEVLSVAAVAPS